MVRQLLSLSKKEDPNFKNTNLIPIIKQVVEIARTSLDKTIKIETTVPDSPAVIQGDINQLEQVFLNLCINAGHSMTIMRPSLEPWGGRISISLHTESTGNPHFNTVLEHWALTVSDTGIGMTREIREQIFTPFFTTKDQGSGTGLGLSMVYSIMENHKGTIDVKSKPGQRTTFTLRFPLLKDEQKDTKQRVRSPTIKGEGTILVIDDEEIVRNIVEEMLRVAGYDALTADNGPRGVEIYRKLKDQIDAVILDLSMPIMSGREVFEELVILNPEVRVIVTSGYTDDKRLDELSAMNNTLFLPKPFSLKKLTGALSQIRR